MTVRSNSVRSSQEVAVRLGICSGQAGRLSHSGNRGLQPFLKTFIPISFLIQFAFLPGSSIAHKRGVR